jgi:hypothetical protein
MLQACSLILQPSIDGVSLLIQTAPRAAKLNLEVLFGGFA